MTVKCQDHINRSLVSDYPAEAIRSSQARDDESTPTDCTRPMRIKAAVEKGVFFFFILPSFFVLSFPFLCPFRLPKSNNNIRGRE